MRNARHPLTADAMKAVTDSELIAVTHSEAMAVTIGAKRRWRMDLDRSDWHPSKNSMRRSPIKFWEERNRRRRRRGGNVESGAFCRISKRGGKLALGVFHGASFPPRRGNFSISVRTERSDADELAIAALVTSRPAECRSAGSWTAVPAEATSRWPDFPGENAFPR